MHHAAVIVLLLDDDQASALLSQLEPAELERLGRAICAMGEVCGSQIANALSEFAAAAEGDTLIAGNHADRFQRALERSLGLAKAGNLASRIERGRKTGIELARWLAPGVLADLLNGEHPQTVAALLIMLEPDQAAQVLARLEPETQPEVIARIARIGPLSHQAVEMLEELLSTRLKGSFGPHIHRLGGPREAADLINRCATQLDPGVLPKIAEGDAELARTIEDELVTFDMLFDLDAQAMGRLLRDVEAELLVMALKGVGEDLRETFFAAMSSRAADGVRDEIALRGKIPLADVRAAQSKIVGIAKKLKEDGELSLGADNADFV